MSLATRCSACGTIFRVVQDQLKVSEGWVRCGQCHEVFNGIEALFDLDSEPAVAARRGNARQPAAAPPTRQFAQQRAQAPIPPTAPPPPASAPVRPAHTGFAPVTQPMPLAPVRPAAQAPSPAARQPASSPVPQVATRTTIAPRFAARLAQEAARAQAATAAAGAPPAIVVTPPVARPAPVPPTTPSAPSARMPLASASSPMPVAASPAPAPMFIPSAPVPLSMPSAPDPFVAPLDTPALPGNFAPTVPMPLDALGELAPLVAPNPPPAGASAPVPPGTPSVPAPFDFAGRAEQAASRWQSGPVPLQSPVPALIPAATPLSWLAPPAAAVDAELPLDAPSPTPGGADLAAELATSAPAQVPIDDLGDVEVVEPAPQVGGSTMPSRLADDAMEERRAGPPTLASMLPEDAGEWPPRRSRKRREPAAGTPESALVDKTKDPRFLREARAGARWRKPWVRASLSLVLLLLVVAAAAQIAWPLRDAIAARWPATQPAWAWVCEQADCRIEAPRAIASLALDGSSLTRTDTEHVLLFSADLHNRAEHEVRMPSFDVSFMDLNGEIVARKVLSPEQLGIRQDALPALGELHVHARLQVGSLPASGFQADLFYP